MGHVVESALLGGVCGAFAFNVFSGFFNAVFLYVFVRGHTAYSAELTYKCGTGHFEPLRKIC